MRGSPFFEGVHQLDIEIGGEPSRTPTFYHDGAYIQASFPARLSELRRLMPDPRYSPARLAPGLGMVSVTCLEYRDTDIGPYNEVMISVLLNEPWFRPNLPGRAVIEGIRRHEFHVAVLHLPVTTEIALRGGVDFYNFPKFIAGIEFDEVGGRRRCQLSEGEEPILELTTHTLPTLPGGREQDFCHLWMDGQPQTAQFSVNRLAAGETARPSAVSLQIAWRHPIALELRRLLVSAKSIRYTYVPRMEAILFGPEHITLPLARKGLAAARALERHPLYS